MDVPNKKQVGLVGTEPPRGLWRAGYERRLTRTFKGMVEEELRRLGPRVFHEWAEANPTEFYRIAARLLPKVVEGEVKMRVVGDLSDGELQAVLVDAEARLALLEGMRVEEAAPQEAESREVVEAEDD